jgi:hypothetical protein
MEVGKERGSVPLIKIGEEWDSVPLVEMTRWSYFRRSGAPETLGWTNHFPPKSDRGPESGFSELAHGVMLMAHQDLLLGEH